MVQVEHVGHVGQLPGVATAAFGRTGTQLNVERHRAMCKLGFWLKIAFYHSP